LTAAATLARVRAARDLYRDHGTIKTQFLLGLLNEVEAALSLRDQADAAHWLPELVSRYPLGTEFFIEHDGFRGRVCGYYRRDDDKSGLALQLNGAKVVHVYGEKWVASTDTASAPVIEPAGIERAGRENLRVRNERDAQRRRAETAERRLAERGATMKIHGISLAVAEALVGLFGGDETDMTVEFIVDGHSGTGFYAWCTEYPEDGSNFLGSASEFSYLSAYSPAPAPAEGR